MHHGQSTKYPSSSSSSSSTAALNGGGRNSLVDANNNCISAAAVNSCAWKVLRNGELEECEGMRKRTGQQSSGVPKKDCEVQRNGSRKQNVIEREQSTTVLRLPKCVNGRDEARGGGGGKDCDFVLSKYQEK